MLGTATVHATESADGSQTENQSDSQDAGTENQKSGWQVEDGGWYYYADGQRATGWLYLPDGTYYLDESTGAMQTGWLNDDGTFIICRRADGVLMAGSILTRGTIWTGIPE